MSDVKDMLQAVINGQHALRKELLGEIGKIDSKLEQFRQETNKRFETIDKRFDSIDIRLDKIGTQLSYLEDDTPTREELDSLAKRVKNVEQQLKN